jgi:asparagine N-glycosylation enzyme membrane subunit Stt3
MVHRQAVANKSNGKETYMLWTLAVVLIALWLLGLVSSYTMGGFIHLLLVVAIIVVLFNLFQGRRHA